MISQRTFQELVDQVNKKFSQMDKIIADLQDELKKTKEPKKIKEKA